MKTNAPIVIDRLPRGGDTASRHVCGMTQDTGCCEENDNKCCVSGCHDQNVEGASPAEKSSPKEFLTQSAFSKRNLLLVFLAVLAAGFLVYPRLTKTTEAVGISELNRSPSQYVGKLTVSGNVGSTNLEEGVFIMVSSSGCCTIPILAPTSAGQKNFLADKTGLALTSLYSGTLPAMGDEVTVTGTWKRVEDSYYLDLEQVTRSGQVILKRK